MNNDKDQAFQEYMKTGGFPYINQVSLKEEQTNVYM